MKILFELDPKLDREALVAQFAASGRAQIRTGGYLLFLDHDSDVVEFSGRSLSP